MKIAALIVTLSLVLLAGCKGYIPVKQGNTGIEIQNPKTEQAQEKPGK